MEEKLLLANRKGKLIGMGWLKEFIELPKAEQSLLYFFLENKAHHKDTAMTNIEISEKLGLDYNRTCTRTKVLTDKKFLISFEKQIQEKMKPVKHFYVPSNMVKDTPEPGRARFTSEKDCKSKPQRSAKEPTVDDRTLKRMDADEKVGLGT